MLGSRNPTVQKKIEKRKRRTSVMSNSKSSNQPVVPSAREALNKFKMEAANDFRVKSHIKISY